MENDKIYLGDSQSRNEILTAFLLGNYLHEEKAQVFSAMESSGLFPEYTKKTDGIVQAGVFLSPEVVYKQTAFPFPFKPFLTFSFQQEVLGAFTKELEYRKKQGLLAKIAGAGYASREDLENKDLESIKDEFIRVLDKYKSNFSYNPEWSFVEDYKKKLLTPYECVLTGIQEFDEKNYGLRLGKLSVLIGFAGQGKSTVALNLAYKAIAQGKNVLFLSTELTKEDISYQLASCASYNILGRDSAFPYKGFLTNENDRQLVVTTLKEKVEDALKDKNRYGRFMPANTDDIYDYSLGGLRSFCESLPDYPHLFIVDYFQRLPVGAKNREEERYKLEAIVRNFTDLALGNEKHQQMAVLLNAQTNRSGYKETRDLKDRKKSFKYDLTSISEISALEKEAALVFAVRQSEELTSKGCIALDVLKCRGGAPQTVEVPIVWRFLALGDQVAPFADTSFNVEEFMKNGQ